MCTGIHVIPHDTNDNGDRSVQGDAVFFQELFIFVLGLLCLVAERSNFVRVGSEAVITAGECDCAAGRDGALDISKSSKIFVYGLAIAAGSGAYMFWSSLLGAGMSGFPAFDEVTMGMKDYILMAIYVAAGCILALFYEKTHHAAHHGAAKLPLVIREITAGFCLGLAGMFVPAIMFSGEEQMAELMIEYGRYLPWMLIGVAFLKILITNICIQFGMRGGHFFPMIFAGVCMGYGIAAFVFPDCASHVAFAAAMVTASLLGGIMKKPLAVTVLLFLCFPAKLLVWIFMAAAVGSFVLSIGSKKA